MRARPAVLLFCLGAASPVRAAEWFTGASLGPSAVAAAWHDEAGLLAASAGYLAQQAARLHVEGAALVADPPLRQGDLGTVRYRQTYRGLPVRGASVVVRLDGSGAVHAVVADVARVLTVDPTPTFSLYDARALLGGLGVEAQAAEGKLGVVRQDDRGGLLAWYIDAQGATGPHRFVVDAHRGVLLGALPLFTHAMGRVYPIDPDTTPATVDEPLRDLVAGAPQHLVGFGGRIGVYNYVSGTLGDAHAPLVVEQKTTANDGTDFLFDPTGGGTDVDPFAEVNIYFHLVRIHDYFTGTLGVDMTGIKWALAAVANYGPSGGYFDNAFFTPWSSAYGVAPGGARNAILIGDGHLMNFAYDSDVFLHEYTHYVNHNTTDFNHGDIDFDQYGTVTMPGAMDEGTADYFSCTVNDDPVVGQASLGASARDLRVPGPHCPDTLTGEAHADGQSLATAAWAIRGALGPAIADRLLWSAMTMFPDSPTFGDAAAGMLAAAASMQLTPAQQAEVRSALDARGLVGCDRFYPLGGHPRAAALFGLQLLADEMGTTCAGVIGHAGIVLTGPVQFTVTPAPGDTAVTFHVALRSVGGSKKLAWNLYARAGQPVTFDSGSGASAYDAASEGLSASSADLVIDASSTPPFDPTQTYYLAIAHQNCGSTVATVTAAAPALPDLAAPPDMALGADGGARAAMGTGCGCAVGRSAAPSPVALLLALALLLAGRGRARSSRR